MPKNPACTGAPFTQAPLQVLMSYPAVEETSGLSVLLPTSEPADAQISYTITTGNMPTITPSIPYKVAPIVWASIENTSGSTAATISWIVLRNGSNYANGTSSSVAATYKAFGTFPFWVSNDSCVLGDTVSIKLWTNQAGIIYLRAHAMAACVTRLFYTLPRACFAWYAYAQTGAYTSEGSPVKPAFSASASSSDTVYWHTGSGGISASVTGITQVPYFINTYSTYGMLMPNYGSYQWITWNISASPYVFSQKRLLTLSLLPLNIKL